MSVVPGFVNKQSPYERLESFLCNKCVLARTKTGALRMDNPTIGETSSVARTESPELCRLIWLSCATFLFLMTVLPAISWAQTHQKAKPNGSDPRPTHAVTT